MTQTRDVMAHEFYPWVCCGDKDCRPVPEPESEFQVLRPGDIYEDRIFGETEALFTGFLVRGTLFPLYRIRRSPDDRYHMCTARGDEAPVWMTQAMSAEFFARREADESERLYDCLWVPGDILDALRNEVPRRRPRRPIRYPLRDTGIDVALTVTFGSPPHDPYIVIVDDDDDPVDPPGGGDPPIYTRTDTDTDVSQVPTLQSVFPWVKGNVWGTRPVNH